MTFKQIASRLTGISIPVFGVQWNPPEPEISVAQRVFSFLEDRRVLYNAYELECPEHCVHSVLEIRRFLTSELGDLSPQSYLTQNLRAMRAACRRFLDSVERQKPGRIIHSLHGGPSTWEFCLALGELRSTIGLRVGALAIIYGLSLDGELEKILPPAPAKDDAAPDASKKI